MCRNQKSDETLQKQAKLQQVSLRLKWVVTAGFAGDFLAKEEGLFVKEGLDVNVLTGGLQANPLILVSAGSDDIGVVGADALLLARSNGAPVVAIAAVFQRNASGFFAKKDSGITRPQDWQGHTIGVIAGNDTETIYRALTKKLKIETSSLTEVPIGFDLTSFLMGKIDVQPGYISNQPNLLKAKGIEVNIIDPGNYGVSMLGNVYFTTEQMIRERPDVVRRFLGAALEGWQMAIVKPEEAVAALIKADPELNHDEQLAVLKDTIPFIKGPDGNIGRMEREAWNQTRFVLIEAGILENSVDIDAVFTNEFLPKK